MTRPVYDVERGIHEIFHARMRGDMVMAEAGRLADKIADGFRADFDTTMDMETVGKALVIAAASLVPLVDPEIPTAVLVNMIGMAGENLVRIERTRAAERVNVGETGPVWCEHVLTWHPVDANQESVELPLYEHITLPEGIGELRSHTREIPPLAAAEGGVSCPS